MTRGAIAALALLALAGCERLAPPAPAPAPPAPPPRPAVLGSCGVAEGDAQIRRGERAFAPLAAGEEIWAGDRVRTAGAGGARLDLGSGAGVRLNGPAEVALSGAEAAGVKAPLAVVLLAEGAARGFVEPGGPGFFLETASGGRVRLQAVGERTAQLRFETAQGALVVAAVEGGARVRGGGSDRELGAGQYVEARTGELGEVRPLGPAPEIVEPAADERLFGLGLVVRLGWEPVVGAQSYQVQVARDPSFQSLRWSAEGPDSHTLFVPRQPGRYLWRVAARDAAGRLGEASEPRLLFCEPTPPEDFLEAPEDGARVAYYSNRPSVELSWRPVPGARSYRVVIARGGDLRAPGAVVASTAETRLVRELAAGEYTWGVYTEDAEPWPLFVAPRHLRIEQSKVKTPSTLEHWGR